MFEGLRVYDIETRDRKAMSCLVMSICGGLRSGVIPQNTILGGVFELFMICPNILSRPSENDICHQCDQVCMNFPIKKIFYQVWNDRFAVHNDDDDGHHWFCTSARDIIDIFSKRQEGRKELAEPTVLVPLIFVYQRIDLVSRLVEMTSSLPLDQLAVKWWRKKSIVRPRSAKDRSYIS